MLTSSTAIKFMRRNACIVTSFAAAGHYHFEFLRLFIGRSAASGVMAALPCFAA
jgi:hypothetical protein